jgi:Uri superfamily endonuclease
MKGAYVLLIEVQRQVSFKLASLGQVKFEPGKWVYIGSAMGEGSTNLENRIKRHFRSQKTVHWHIDHLLKRKNAILHKAIWSESQFHIECDIAREFETGDTEMFMTGPKRFGASDCKKGCSAHIFRQSSISDKEIEDVVESVFRKLGLNPLQTTDGCISQIS